MDQIRKNEQKTYTNIVGFLNNRSLLKKDQDSSLRQSLNRKSIKKQQLIDQLQVNTIQYPLTGRNTINSQTKKRANRQHYPFFTSKNKDNEYKKVFTFQMQDNQPSTVQKISQQKKQVSRSRFYYKDQTVEQIRSISPKSKQYQKIYPLYFQEINQINIVDQGSLEGQTYEDVRIQHFRQRYFNKCRKQTKQYLKGLRTLLKDGKLKLKQTKFTIQANLKHIIQKRTILLKKQLQQIVEQMVQIWQHNQVQLLKNKQIQYLDDLFQIEQQIQLKQIKIDHYLTLFKSLPQSQNLPFQNQQWQKISADLLLFNYQNSIVQLNGLCDKLKDTINQKCTNALSILLSSNLFQSNFDQEVLSVDAKSGLKQNVLEFISQGTTTNRQRNFSFNTNHIQYQQYKHLLDNSNTKK